METLFIIIIFFVLGTLALYAVTVAKNVAHVLFVVVLGWAAWHYVGPHVIDSNSSATETVLTLNDAYKQQAKSNVRTIADPDFSQKFSLAIEKDINKLWDSAQQGTGINAWVPDDEQGKLDALKKHASAPSATLYDYLVRTVRNFLGDVFRSASE